MIHILLLILKIIGIILLAVLFIAVLVLFFPVTYVGKGEFDKKNIKGTLTAHWLFHILHFKADYIENNVSYVLRVFGIPVLFSKKKKHKEEKNQGKKKSEYDKKDSRKETVSSDIQNTKKIQAEQTVKKPQKHTQHKKKTNDTRKKKKKKGIWARILEYFGKIKNMCKDFVKDAKSAYNKYNNKYKETKNFIVANTTKEAYHYGKRIVLKFIKHIFPKSIRGNMCMGFKEPHTTGGVLGIAAMIYGTLGINPEKIVITPDFQNEVFEGKIKCKGYILLGVAGVYILKFYFKKEIHDIIKKFS